MARSLNENRRPRIRKSAPTVREKLEAAREKEEQPPKKRRVSVSSPLAKWQLKDKRTYQIAKKPFSLLKKGLSFIVPRYFVNSWRELRLVQWPARRETWRLTAAVFVFAIVFGALVAGVDKGLDELFKKVVLK